MSPAGTDRRRQADRDRKREWYREVQEIRTRRRARPSLLDSDIFQAWAEAQATDWEQSRAYIAGELDGCTTDAQRRAVMIRLGTPTRAGLDALAVLFGECEKRSRKTGIPHRIGHIVPIVGRGVCGLNLLANLQIVPETGCR